MAELRSSKYTRDYEQNPSFSPQRHIRRPSPSSGGRIRADLNTVVSSQSIPSIPSIQSMHSQSSQTQASQSTHRRRPSPGPGPRQQQQERQQAYRPSPNPSPCSSPTRRYISSSSISSSSRYRGPSTYVKNSSASISSSSMGGGAGAGAGAGGRGRGRSRSTASTTAGTQKQTINSSGPDEVQHSQQQQQKQNYQNDIVPTSSANATSATVIVTPSSESSSQPQHNEQQQQQQQQRRKQWRLSPSPPRFRTNPANKKDPHPINNLYSTPNVKAMTTKGAKTTTTTTMRRPSPSPTYHRQRRMDTSSSSSVQSVNSNNNDNSTESAMRRLPHHHQLQQRQQIDYNAKISQHSEEDNTIITNTSASIHTKEEEEQQRRRYPLEQNEIIPIPTTPVRRIVDKSTGLGDSSLSSQQERQRQQHEESSLQSSPSVRRLADRYKQHSSSTSTSTIKRPILHRSPSPSSRYNSGNNNNNNSGGGTGKHLNPFVLTSSPNPFTSNNPEGNHHEKENILRNISNSKEEEEEEGEDRKEKDDNSINRRKERTATATTTTTATDENNDHHQTLSTMPSSSRSNINNYWKRGSYKSSSSLKMKQSFPTSSNFVDGKGLKESSFVGGGSGSFIDTKKKFPTQRLKQPSQDERSNNSLSSLASTSIKEEEELTITSNNTNNNNNNDTNERKKNRLVQNFWRDQQMRNTSSDMEGSSQVRYRRGPSPRRRQLEGSSSIGGTINSTSTGTSRVTVEEGEESNHSTNNKNEVIQEKASNNGKEGGGGRNNAKIKSRQAEDDEGKEQKQEVEQTSSSSLAQHVWKNKLQGQQKQELKPMNRMMRRSPSPLLRQPRGGRGGGEEKSRRQPPYQQQQSKGQSGEEDHDSKSKEIESSVHRHKNQQQSSEGSASNKPEESTQQEKDRNTNIGVRSRVKHFWRDQQQQRQNTSVNSSMQKGQLLDVNKSDGPIRNDGENVDKNEQNLTLTSVEEASSSSNLEEKIDKASLNFEKINTSIEKKDVPEPPFRDRIRQFNNVKGAIKRSYVPTKTTPRRTDSIVSKHEDNLKNASNDDGGDEGEEIESKNSKVIEKENKQNHLDTDIEKSPITMKAPCHTKPSTPTAKDRGDTWPSPFSLKSVNKSNHTRYGSSVASPISNNDTTKSSVQITPMRSAMKSQQYKKIQTLTRIAPQPTGDDSNVLHTPPPKSRKSMQITHSSTASTAAETTFDDSQDFSSSFGTPQRRIQSNSDGIQISSPVIEEQNIADTSNMTDNTHLVSITDVKRRLWDEGENLNNWKSPSHEERESPNNTNDPKQPAFKSRFYHAANVAQKKVVCKTPIKNSPHRFGSQDEMRNNNSDHVVVEDSPITGRKPSFSKSKESLLEKLNSVRRDDPSEALAAIDSILQAEESITKNNEPCETMVTPSIDEDYDDDDLSTEFEDDSDFDDSTVSSITNPTYHPGTNSSEMHMTRRQQFNILVKKNGRLPPSYQSKRPSVFLREYPDRYNTGSHQYSDYHQESRQKGPFTPPTTQRESPSRTPEENNVMNDDSNESSGYHQYASRQRTTSHTAHSMGDITHEDEENLRENFSDQPRHRAMYPETSDTTKSRGDLKHSKKEDEWTHIPQNFFSTQVAEAFCDVDVPFSQQQEECQMGTQKSNIQKDQSENDDVVESQELPMPLAQKFSRVARAYDDYSIPR